MSYKQELQRMNPDNFISDGTIKFISVIGLYLYAKYRYPYNRNILNQESRC